MVKKSAQQIRAVPVLGDALVHVAGHKVQRLLGYWVIWHAFDGDLEAIGRSGVISRAGAFAQRREFREVFGVEVGDFWPEAAQNLPLGR